jgi:pSer/pThr/pTyr-binding forkhead associated (FHA) protein/S1-C subfamily serine protease
VRVAGPAQFQGVALRSYIAAVILRDERRGREYPIPDSGARLGRDPTLEIVFDESELVVSALHARLYRDPSGAWWLEDLGSTNGTWLEGRRIAEPCRLEGGERFTLGQRGPSLRAVLPGVAPSTRAEPVLPKEASEPGLRLRRVAGGEDLLAAGREILIGRAAECAIPLRTVVDTVVSKRHCVVEFHPDGSATLSDLESRNGTYLNGERIDFRTALGLGDRIMLGWQGPEFEVRVLGGAAMAEGEGAEYRPDLQPAKTVVGMVQAAQSQARHAPGKRTAVFVRELARQAVRESSLVFRITTLGMIAALAVTVTIALRSARREAVAAQSRLAAAESAFAHQLRVANEAQQRAQREISQLQRDLEAARRAAVSRGVIDSLERRLAEAEARAARAQAAAPVAAPDFTRVATQNQRAIGLVVVRWGAGDSVMGSGFAITRSGYFVTNRHVVYDPSRNVPRSVEVIMADTRTPLPADVIAVSTVQEQDLAVLRVRNYRGDVVRAIDWQGERVRQGAPAALIGFPGGASIAVDAGGYVRTSMFAGIIAAVTAEWIRFGGSTFTGASGSPIFNADGEVIAVHFGGLREGPGLGFSVPVGRVRRWLPADARAELGLGG